ncbi:hypothetical protein HYPSUDRAFT_61230 [Hypholoma sublateritium FD-334 SS-4]|uniref:Hyaluronan/mRNA-binding protein domain-containing protein n=1 Tax=Hypholoma sublateritium (strain FD-334 SS-4) TaxID=945553 RepID=A0A0D2LMJ0_HYPSF|nr:hypothetical protein HYPSUDRAFT_61230 [Hypholoma sublateritium FD-334 SS-4]
MSVATKNPFALLDGTSSTAHDAPAAPAPVTKDEPAPAPAAAARGTAQKSRGGPAARGGKYYPRGGKPKDAAAPAAADDSEGQKKFEGREPRDATRARGRGRGAPRGGRGRPFDRHSQTGKTDSDKKLHQTWGGDDGNTELKTEEAAVVDAAAETTGAEWGGETPAADWGGAETTVDAWTAAATTETADAEAKPERRPRRDAEPEEEDNTLTLDQYLAQQKDKDTIVPKLETRKANDGADDIFKDAVALTKNEEEETYFVGKSKSAPKARAKKEEKVYLEIDARFERPDRGGGRGRGRGEARGGDRARGTRGRGAPRGGRQNGNSAPTVNVDDQTAFPSLS